jgi:hypothetical protein
MEDMEMSRVTPARDRERISALTAGLAATIIMWIFAAGYAPQTLDALGEYSPWLYGPVSTGMWAVFSAIAYLLLIHRRQRESPPRLNETYRCHELNLETPPVGPSVCANRKQKNHLAAVTAGFALTIMAWVGALSVMPNDWLDSLSVAPPWSYCVASVGLWAALSFVVYAAFTRSDRRHRRGLDYRDLSPGQSDSQR